AKDFADAVGRQTPESDFAAPLEDFMDGEVAFEDEVAAVFDLRHRVEARQVHLAAFPLGEFGAQKERPIVELLRMICGLSRSATACSAAHRPPPGERCRSCGNIPYEYSKGDN